MSYLLGWGIVCVYDCTEDGGREGGQDECLTHTQLNT